MEVGGHICVHSGHLDVKKTMTTLELSNGSLRRLLRKRLRFADSALAIDCGLRYSQLSTILHSWPPVRTTLIIQC